MTTTSELIKTYRKNAGLSFKKLGVKLGYTNAQFIYAWEVNRARPPMEKLKSLCAAINLDKKIMKRALIKDYKELLKQYL